MGLKSGPHPVCLVALSFFSPGRVGHPGACYRIVRQTGVKPASQANMSQARACSMHVRLVNSLAPTAKTAPGS